MTTIERIHRYVIVLLVSSLSVTVVLKVGEIQYLEIVMAADFLILCILFARDGFRIRLFRPFLSVASSWGIFLLLAFLLALVALRQNFYTFNDTLLKRPLLVTVSRMGELFLDVFYMLYLASLYREDERLCRLGARTFFWMGVAGGVYGIVTFPLNYFWDLELGTHGNLHRFRGFDNEGGPYGVYMIGVCLLTMAMARRGWLSRNEFRYGIALFSICLIGSQSKAAFIGVAVLGVTNALFLLRGWRRLSIIGVTCTGILILGTILDLPDKLNAYAVGAAQYQTLSNIRSDDANVVRGRVAGAFLTPAMIAAHPWLGIGWGNYPLVRDDPEYRRGTAFATGSVDSPSLGPIDYIVDLGFPLFFYFTWAELKPLYLLWKHGANTWILNMAAVQIFANWFGTHLNVIHPWIIVGLALGMGFAKNQDASAATPQAAIAA